MVIGRRNADLSAKIIAREHEVVSGVASELGGGDEGQDPHELLESSLAACTIITMQMYANRKQWDLRTSVVTVRIASETPAGATMSREIQLTGNLTDEQRQRILEIANKCPIHQLLTRSIKIETILLK
jgi:putative redox protein